MNMLTKDELQQCLENARIKPRIRRELRFVPDEITDWQDRDFLAVTNRSRSEGVLLWGDATVPFRLQARRPNKSGRVEAIICDLCATWRRGTESAVITFQKETSTQSFLCCADLDCSLHVRGKTPAATLSRTQLREDITPEGRVARFSQRLASIIGALS